MKTHQKTRRGIAALVTSTLAAAALLLGVSAPALAGGSDSPTPYTVAVDGVHLPAGDSFQAHGHINWRTTSGSYGMHFDPNNGHPGGAFIGKDFFPISLAPGECITWVQISHYNEHFGEGGQQPVCAPEEEPEPPFTGVEKYTPAYSATCEGWTYAHPEFRLPTGQEPTSYTVRIGADTEPVAYVPGEVLSGVFDNPYQPNGIDITLWAHYADGKPFAKQQLGQTKLRAAACEKPRPEQPAPLTGVEERMGKTVCTVPADGTSTTAREERSWEQGWAFDETAWEWVAGEVVYGDWASVDPVIVEATECAPVVEEPEEEEPAEGPEEQVIPKVTPKADPEPVKSPAPVAPVLAQTAAPGAQVAWYLALPLGVAGFTLGALLLSAALRRKH